MALDLKQFSTDDLTALQSGDLTKLSTPGLKILQQEQANQARRDKLASEMTHKAKPDEYMGEYDPTRGMSTGERFGAGAGKAFADVGRGIKQLLDKPAVALESVVPGADALSKKLGMPTARDSAAATQADINESRKMDKPLVNTTAGTVGNIGGKVALALPTVAIPGSQTLLGAGAVGAGQGFIEPVADGESRLKNTVIGGLSAPAGALAGRGLAAGAKGVKSLVEPFTAGGRDAIAARTLQRFGVEAGDVAGLSSNPTVTGARTTMAEQIARPEGAAAAARLQDSLRTLDPEIAAKLAAREMENNAARVGTLTELAGKDGARDFAGAARSATSQELYGKAFGSQLTPTAAQQTQIAKLLQAPAVRDAVAAAKETAANKGLNIASPEGSVEGLHLMKLAMDDQIAALSNGTASQVNKAMSIKTAQSKLVDLLESMSPAYKEARLTHAAMSEPLNQMDVAGELLKKGSSATADLSGTTRLMPDALGRAVKDEGKLISQATGRDLPQKTLADLLDPDQLAKLRGVVGETDKLAAVGRAANGPGSATAQRMASQNVLRQVLGPTGLPESWAESTLLNTVMRPVQFAYNGVAEPKIQATLADLVMNPAKAQAVMQAARSGGAQSLPKEVQAALPYLEQALKQSVPAAALAGQR